MISLKKQVFVSLLCVFFVPILIIASERVTNASQTADQAMPGPPEVNPHPPQTQQDKDRVAFGDVAIQILQIPALASQPQGVAHSIKNAKIEFNLDLACLKNPTCIQSNQDLQNYIASIQSAYGGKLAEFRHTHIIPWSVSGFAKIPFTESRRLRAMSATNLKADQYLLHSYVRFEKYGIWYHLDVVVSEDESGQLRFQRFYLIEIPTESEHLAPGDVC